MKNFLRHIPVLLLTAVCCGKLPSAELTPEERQDAVRYDAAAVLLTSLLDVEVTPDQVQNYTALTSEPCYGQAFEGDNDFERTVIVTNAAGAESSFCSLAGWREDILEGTADGYRIDLSSIGVGRLEFFRTPDGSNLGYATVDIPCIPHLQRITYKRTDQLGDNAPIPYIQSPALYGDVYLHDGRYYICTRETTGYTKDSSGILVCMEAGKGTNWSYHISDESWGCWKPKQSWADGDLIDSYLLLCADPEFTQDKARIIKKWPGKVFPLPQRWSSHDKQETVGDGTWGFAALEPGYSHVTHYKDNYADEKSHSDRRKDDWKGVRVVIIRDATEGDYRFWSARWWRRCHHYVLPWICKWDKGIYSDTHMYTSQEEWDQFFNTSPIVYTMNAVRFYDELPQGYILQTVWDE